MTAELNASSLSLSSSNPPPMDWRLPLLPDRGEDDPPLEEEDRRSGMAETPEAGPSRLALCSGLTAAAAAAAAAARPWAATACGARPPVPSRPCCHRLDTAHTAWSTQFLRSAAPSAVSAATMAACQYGTSESQHKMRGRTEPGVVQPRTLCTGELVRLIKSHERVDVVHVQRAGDSLLLRLVPGERRRLRRRQHASSVGVLSIAARRTEGNPELLLARTR